ncbi:MAG: hypothetical protein FWE20_13220 [Defluviitaleaceae bacterium]|jgi:erythromycin esterase-like protein|nr:hypothetical protein [Defluviitaleaceae bacterium]
MGAGSRLSYEEKVKVRDLLLKILEHTKSTELTATEHSVDDYINMVESRQALFDELASFKPQEFATVATDIDESKKEQQGSIELDEEIQKIVNQIVEREEHHKSKVAGMMDDIRKGLREISTEKSINSVYLKDSSSYESGMIFNTKN